MSEMRDLYQEVILDHYRKPRNYYSPDHADRKAEGHNPLCGDQVTVYLVMDGDIVKEVGFQGTGCAISTASASMMTETLKGKSKNEIEKYFTEFHDLVTGKSTKSVNDLGKLAAFSGVSEYPLRVKCASLAWHTLKAALQNQKDVVSTEA